jgi:hypothetical protein
MAPRLVSDVKQRKKEKSWLVFTVKKNLQQATPPPNNS